MAEYEKLKAGKRFQPGDPGLKAIKLQTHKLNLNDNNLTKLWYASVLCTAQIKECLK